MFFFSYINNLLGILFSSKSKSLEEKSKWPLNIKSKIKEPISANFIRLLWKGISITLSGWQHVLEKLKTRRCLK